MSFDTGKNIGKMHSSTQSFTYKIYHLVSFPTFQNFSFCLQMFCIKFFEPVRNRKNTSQRRNSTYSHRYGCRLRKFLRSMWLLNTNNPVATSWKKCIRFLWEVYRHRFFFFFWQLSIEKSANLIKKLRKKAQILQKNG